MVMCDYIWATQEVFNNVHPRLGGLHTIMSSNIIMLWLQTVFINHNIFLKNSYYNTFYTVVVQTGQYTAV